MENIGNKDNGVLKISESDLDEVIKFSSNKVVGKVLKRFEIHQNIKVLKTEIRELLFESMRDTKDLLIASGNGLNITQFKFKGKSASTNQ